MWISKREWLWHEPLCVCSCYLKWEAWDSLSSLGVLAKPNFAAVFFASTTDSSGFSLLACFGSGQCNVLECQSLFVN